MQQIRRKRIIALTFVAATVVSWALWPTSYRFACFMVPESFDPGQLRTYFGPYAAAEPATQGQGCARVCEAAFHAPTAYVGPTVYIPKGASTRGVLVLTHGKQTRLLPLFTWVTDGGRTHFACKGPTPVFAIHADSQDAFLRRLELRLTKCVRRTEIAAGGGVILRHSGQG